MSTKNAFLDTLEYDLNNDYLSLKTLFLKIVYARPRIEPSTSQDITLAESLSGWSHDSHDESLVYVQIIIYIECLIYVKILYSIV